MKINKSKQMNVKNKIDTFPLVTGYCLSLLSSTTALSTPPTPRSSLVIVYSRRKENER